MGEEEVLARMQPLSILGNTERRTRKIPRQETIMHCLSVLGAEKMRKLRRGAN